MTNKTKKIKYHEDFEKNIKKKHPTAATQLPEQTLTVTKTLPKQVSTTSVTNRLVENQNIINSFK